MNAPSGSPLLAAGAWLYRRAENVLALMLAVMFAAFILQIAFRYKSLAGGNCLVACVKSQVKFFCKVPSRSQINLK